MEADISILLPLEKSLQSENESLREKIRSLSATVEQQEALQIAGENERRGLRNTIEFLQIASESQAGRITQLEEENQTIRGDRLADAVHFDRLQTDYGDTAVRLGLLSVDADKQAQALARAGREFAALECDYRQLESALAEAQARRIGRQGSTRVDTVFKVGGECCCYQRSARRRRRR